MLRRGMCALQLRVFSSSKHALAYATAAIAMPEYKLSEQEAASIRAVGKDLLRRAFCDVCG